MKVIYMMTRRFQWLASIINRKGYTTGAEIGSAVGLTTSYLLKNCKNLNPLIVVDDWRPITDRRTPETPNVNESWYLKPLRPRFDKAVAGYENRIKILEGVSWEMADRIKDGSLDWVFIDASHDTESVMKDYSAWKAKVKPDGLFCGHDIHMSSVLKALEHLEVPFIKVGIDNLWVYDNGIA